jgi:hypothetical protein
MGCIIVEYCQFDLNMSYHISGFFSRELNFTIFFQIGGIFLAVFDFHDPEI